MTSAIAVAVLVAGGVYLILQRGLLRVTIGFVLLGHAANLVLLAAGGTDRRDPPIVNGATDLASTADPLPQAFVLTAIVITFAITVYLVGLAGAGGDEEADSDDDEADDLTDAVEEDALRAAAAESEDLSLDTDEGDVDRFDEGDVRTERRG